MRELQNLRKQVKWHSYLNEEMKENKNKIGKGQWKEDYTKKHQFKDGEKFHFEKSSSNQIAEKKG